MSASYRIAVLVGSLRKDSHTRKVARAMEKLAPPELAFEFVEIGDLALYNEDLEGEGKTPEAWTRFREAVRATDGVLFFTPEYNRSVPGVLKNAIDVGSRPGGKSAWLHKPGGVVGVSPYALGAFGANQHLRQSMVFLDVPMMQMPEAYITFAGKLFADNGELASEDTKKFFTAFMKTYAAWVGTFAKK